MGHQAPTAGIADKEIDEKLKRQKEIDDWLPITSSRNAKWWYSTFHNVTAMVGAGVLGLPYAMSELGWGPGVVIMVLSWIITLYTLWQMVEMHEMVPGRRFNRYHELGQYAFGEKLGLYIVVPQQLVVEVGVCIVYMVTGGQSLQKFHNLVCTDCKKIKLTFFIMIFASVHFVLSHLPNFNSISGVSLAAAVMSLSYSTIAWAASVHKGVQEDVQYGYKSHSTPGTVFNFFGALGNVAFAYTGHNVVLEIVEGCCSCLYNCGTLLLTCCIHWLLDVRQRGRGQHPQVVEEACVAYRDGQHVCCGSCHWKLPGMDHAVFDRSLHVVLLHSVSSLQPLQIYAMPVFDMMETALVKQLHFRPTRSLRFVVRSFYVGKWTSDIVESILYNVEFISLLSSTAAFTMFIGMTFPFFDGLLSFFGGFAFAPTTYFLPCIMWLAIYKPKRFGLSWCANWICIFFGLCLMILSPIGGLRTIIIQAKTYKFYS